jgi:hypothetical protein
MVYGLYEKRGEASRHLPLGCWSYCNPLFPLWSKALPPLVAFLAQPIPLQVQAAKGSVTACLTAKGERAYSPPWLDIDWARPSQADPAERRPSASAIS